MVTWLTRSLLFIVAGAVLAYAVTWHNDHIDLQTTGVILLLVGVFDLLLNFGLTMYLRQPLHHDVTARADPSRRPYPSQRPGLSQRPGPPSAQRPTPTSDDERYATRPIHRDHPDWH